VHASHQSVEKCMIMVMEEKRGRKQNKWMWEEKNVYWW
jgi:hypothetical protein